MTEASNTGEIRPNKGQFTKGDPRINRNGRPKSFDALRKLAQSLADEIARDKDGHPIIIEGHIATKAEMILRGLSDANPERFLEIGYGKVPTPLEVSGDMTTKVVITYADNHSDPAAPASGAADDQGE